MVSMIRMAALCLLTAVVCAQTPPPPRPVSEHRSNGVVEIQVVPEISEREHDMRNEGASVYAPWRGLLRITIRNVSWGLVDLVELAPPLEYEFNVLDSSGASVPLTEWGKKAQLARDPLNVLSGPVSSITIGVAGEYSRDIYLADQYQLKPGQAYTIRIWRSEGLPKVDEHGKPLKEVELRYTLKIPDYGIAR